MLYLEIILIFAYHMNTPINKSFFFIRHGETHWNVKNLIMGQQDIPLNETGITQAHQAKQHFEKTKIKTICTSSLQRAKQTAEIINQELECPLIVMDELKECAVGIREGQLKNYESWIHWTQGLSNPEGAETYQDFFRRIRKGIELALSYPSPVLIVSHSTVYSAILDNLNLLSNHFDSNPAIPNCTPLLFRTPRTTDHPWIIKKIKAKKR